MNQMRRNPTPDLASGRTILKADQVASHPCSHANNVGDQVTLMKIIKKKTSADKPRFRSTSANSAKLAFHSTMVGNVRPGSSPATKAAVDLYPRLHWSAGKRS
jgi:hypothetical protein